MTIFVGSTNPVKINSVRLATQEHWPDAEIIGLEVQSGIKEQPLTDEETRLGAQNRAKSVLAQGLASREKNPDETYIAIGLEGGVFENDNGEMWSTVWAVLVDTGGRLFEANGARVKVPEIIAEKIRSGQEMGPIVSAVTGEENIKHKQGMFGVITKNFVTRTQEYSTIAKMALGLWFGRDWDSKLQST